MSRSTIRVSVQATWLLLAVFFWLGSTTAQPPNPAPPAPRPWVSVSAGGAHGETATVSLRFAGAGLTYVLAASPVYSPASTPPILPPIAILSVGLLLPDGTARVPIAVPRAPQLAGTRIHLMAWVHDNAWPSQAWLQSDVCTWVIAHQSARRFVPAMNTLSFSANDGHARALLADGRVLFCGGRYSGGIPQSRLDAQVYDPVRKTATTVANMTTGRCGHVAVPLPDGTVLVVGGDTNILTPTAELYDPQTSSFRSLGAVPTYLSSPYAVSIRDPASARPYVLIGGGFGVGDVSDLATLWDVTAGKVAALVQMGRKRMDAAAVALPGFGAVLVTGGSDGNGRHRRDAELFLLPARKFFPWGGLTTPRAGHAMVRLDASHALVLGGGPTSQGSADLEVFDAFTGKSVLLPLRMAVARYRFGVVTLADGSLLIAGGNSYAAALPGRTPEIVTVFGSTVLRPIPEFSPLIELQALASGGVIAIGGGATFDLQ